MPDRTKEELQALLTKIQGVEGQTERAGAIRQRIAEMEEAEGDAEPVA